MNNCIRIIMVLSAGMLINATTGYSDRQPIIVELQDKEVLARFSSDIQKRLKEFSVSDETDRKFKSNKKEAARKWSDVDRVKLAQQIFLFFRTNRFVNEREGWRIAGLFNAMEFKDEEKMAAILPILNTSDKALRKMLYGELKSIDERDNGRSHDFSQFSALISQRKNDPPTALFRYMFDRDPKAAVLSLVSIYGDKTAEVELADKLEGDPKAALSLFAGWSEWWAHLYVAAMMKKNPQLRDPEIIKKLEKDDNPLVREALSEIKSGQDQSK